MNIFGQTLNYSKGHNPGRETGKPKLTKRPPSRGYPSPTNRVISIRWLFRGNKKTQRKRQLFWDLWVPENVSTQI